MNFKNQEFISFDYKIPPVIIVSHQYMKGVYFARLFYFD
jgi:hypothetical protein